MHRARAHGAGRMILTIFGLNSLVVGAWLLLQNALGPTGAMRDGLAESLPQLRAGWQEPVGMWFDGLVILAIFGVLLGIAAWRIFRAVETGAPEVGADQDAPPPDAEEVRSPLGRATMFPSPSASRAGC